MAPKRTAGSPRTAGPLTRDRVLDAALALVDETGHEKLTMRTLASALGVDPMAPYHYVPNKAALLDGLVERAWAAVSVGEIDVDGEPSAQLVDAFCRVYDGLVRHPNVLPLVATRSVATPQSLALAERALELLRHRSGLSPAAALRLVNTLAALTIGRALAESAPAAGEQSMEDVLRLARAFPLLAEATRTPPDTSQDTLRRALQGIVAAWGIPSPATES